MALPLDEPLVTVGIPAFNSARTLERAIASVRCQSMPRWRLLIADDMSDDRTWQICEWAATRDPRIEIWRQPARRMFMNFGDLLERATTRYFVWLAADDYWAPGFLQACLAVLEDQPGAVSVLPRCSFVGPGPETRPPNTNALDGTRTDRLRRYLAHPGGTRMYGLARTEALKAAFPRRNMNAYDWYLMIGLLAQGPQAAVDERLLFREKTDWTDYVDIVDRLYRNPVFRRFPVLDMSLAALAARRMPLGNLPDLLKLNIRKHEEYLAVTRPLVFGRWRWLYRLLRCPIATNADKAAAIAGQIARKDPARREAATAALLRAASGGDGAAALMLGRLREEAVVDGDPAAAYTMAEQADLPDGRFHKARLALADRDRAHDAWIAILGAAHRGSTAARAFLLARAAEGKVPPKILTAAKPLIAELSAPGDKA